MVLRRHLLGFAMLGFCIMLLAFYLAAGLLARKKPTNFERHVGMVSFFYLTLGIIGQRIPLSTLPVLLLLLAEYLYQPSNFPAAL